MCFTSIVCEHVAYSWHEQLWCQNFQGIVGVTSIIVKQMWFSTIVCDLSVGWRYVSGGNRTSSSFGNADNHLRSAPRCRLLVVTILKRRHSLLTPYDTAVSMLVVVDMGASCMYVCEPVNLEGRKYVNMTLQNSRKHQNWVMSNKGISDNMITATSLHLGIN